jgi:hypothetical protein
LSEPHHEAFWREADKATSPRTDEQWKEIFARIAAEYPLTTPSVEDIWDEISPIERRVMEFHTSSSNCDVFDSRARGPFCA